MRRDRRSIWHGVIGMSAAMAVVGIAILFSSCTKEPTGNSMRGADGMEVRVSFPRSVVSKAATEGTEVGEADENRLDRVTILIFNEDGMKLESVLSEDVTAANTSLATTQPKWESDQTLIMRELIEISKPKKIYAVANWSKTVFDKATYTEVELNEELTTIAAVADMNDNKAFPMLMSGSQAVANVTTQFYNVTVDMARQASKLRTLFTIPINVQEYLPQIEWQTDLMKITVVNVPNKSYVVGRECSPIGVTLLNSVALAVDDTKPAAADQTVPATKDLKWSESVYVVENPVMGATPAIKDESTYIVVQLPYKNRISGTTDHDNYYKLYVNDTHDSASPHKVLRNTIYNFNIRILGMGLPINNLVPDVNIDDQLTVNSWEKGEIVDTEAPNSYFNIDRASLGLQFFADTAKATIVTNVTDWKLVKEDGTTMLSFAEGKNTSTIDGITYTLGGLATAAALTVSNGAGLLHFATQKMFFEVKNLKVPFSVAVDNGWIPNWILTEGGWPAILLPLEGGLQFAKRGDLVLPGGVAAADDPAMLWQTTGSSTAGTAAGLGYGKSSTAAMAGAEYPAAQYCRDMGEGWFLPSRDELSFIYASMGLLGASYTFTYDSYWSSSESNASNAWSVDFNSGTQHQNTKQTTGNLVRCAKATITYPTLTITPSKENIPSDGGTYTVQLTSNYAWSASPLDGVTFSPSSGTAGTNVSVEITVMHNTGAARDVSVEFQCTDGLTTATAIWTGSQLVAPPTPFIEIKGVKWTTGNLVVNGTRSCKVGAATDYGLYFQFGSLVGWSGGASGNGEGVGSPALAINIKPSAYTGGTTWTTCGYYSTGSSGGLPVADATTTGIGDPCRFYLGSPWRTPTMAEFTSSLCNGYTGGTALVSANVAWQASPTGMSFNNNSAKLFIPASGLRDDSNGAISYVGERGYYWSESAINATSGYYLYSSSISVYPQIYTIRRTGMPVRCVQ